MIGQEAIPGTMKTFTLIIELLNCIPEVLLIFMFYNGILDKKYKARACCAACLAGAAIFAAEVVFVTNPYIRAAVTFVFLLASAVLLYKNPLAVKLFAALYYFLVVFISETVFVVILMLSGYGNTERLFSSDMGRIAGMAGTKIFDFWLIVYSCRIYKRRAAVLPVKYWVQILLMPFLSVLILNQLFSYELTGTRENVMYILSIAGLLYINLSVFNYFESYEKQVRLAALEQIMERENKNYRDLAASYSEIRSIKHDLRNQAAVLNDMLSKESYDAVKEYIKKLYSTVENVTSVYCTGAPAVDSIINLKCAYAKSLGIDFSADIRADTAGIDPIALCRILGNALDNAIEACERAEQEEKSISMELIRRGDMLMCRVTNTSPQVDINDLSTSKPDKAAHGIGMQSIKNTVEALDGHLACEYAAGRFSLKILLAGKPSF